MSVNVSNGCLYLVMDVSEGLSILMLGYSLLAFFDGSEGCGGPAYTMVLAFPLFFGARSPLKMGLKKQQVRRGRMSRGDRHTYIAR